MSVSIKKQTGTSVQPKKILNRRTKSTKTHVHMQIVPLLVRLRLEPPVNGKEKEFTIKYYKSGSERASKISKCSHEQIVGKLMFKEDEDNSTTVEDEELDEDA